MSHVFEVYNRWPFEPVRGSGSFLYDRNGQSYLDLYGGHAVISIGHTHPYYTERVTRQLEKLPYYSNSVIMSIQEALAESLCRVSECPEHRLFMVNSGAEANENALKLASFTTGRDKIIVFDRAFHGRTSLAVAATDNSAIQAPVNRSHHITRVPLNDVEAFDAVMDAQVAAVLIEGIQGVGGAFTPEEEFLRHLEKACRQFGSMLILDEIQSGYGRSGKFFAFQHAGITPDIITIAKGMGNGFPVGGLMIHQSIDAVYGSLGTTFGGNHLACAAAQAVLDVIEAEELIQQSHSLGLQLSDVLRQLPGIREVRGRGLMLGIALDTEADAVRQRLFREHRMLTGNASEKDTIRLLPALNIHSEALQDFTWALEKSLQ